MMKTKTKRRPKEHTIVSKAMNPIMQSSNSTAKMPPGTGSKRKSAKKSKIKY